MVKNTSHNNKDGTTGASSTPSTGASTPGTGAPQRTALLFYKIAKQGDRAISTKRARLAMPFMTGRDVFPGPAYPPGPEPKAFGEHEPSDIRILRLKNKGYKEY